MAVVRAPFDPTQTPEQTCRAAMAMDGSMAASPIARGHEIVLVAGKNFHRRQGARPITRCLRVRSE
jgi:hypothetical protein